MPRMPALFERLSRAVRRRLERAQRELRRATAAADAARPARRRPPAPRAAHLAVPAAPGRRAGIPRRRRARPRPPLEQLALDLGPERPRWQFSRLAAHSPHHARI